MRNLSWLAGFYEGRGSITTGLSGKKKTYPYIHAAICTTDPAILLEVRSLVGGSVGGPYNHKNNVKPIYIWRLTRIEDIEEFYNRIKKDLLPQRLHQFEETIREYKLAKQRYLR